VACWKIKCCRKIGILASKNDNLISPIKETYLAIYIDIGLCSSLGILTIYIANEDEVNEFFEGQNIIATCVSMICFLIFCGTPFYIHHVVRENFEQLENPDVIKVHGPIFNEFDNKSYMASLFYFFKLGRIAFLIYLMIFFRDYTLLQVNCYVIMFVISMGYLLQF
jgi:hypothetical protein